MPISAAWIIAPAVAWWISCPGAIGSVSFSLPRQEFLEKTARRTWRFFETLVVAQDNWLPPDNIQESPTTVIAPRTSPTNIGMGLLADLSAYDFGYLPVAKLLERTGKTFSTLERLERFRGHFYNWYDTRSLKPLLPLYVSTVDSGNFTGHLLVFRRGLLELIDAKVRPSRLFEGIRDTLRVLKDEAKKLSRNTDDKTIALVPASILRQVQQLEISTGDRVGHRRLGCGTSGST